ncbi:unnamed protein product [Orchesella dallaii]|uniref:Uncharacterized protein n=1 Tax=Orchesella dallaii TaxID=48710 RepID=A0ABP1R684_9HEXA
MASFGHLGMKPLENHRLKIAELDITLQAELPSGSVGYGRSPHPPQVEIGDPGTGTRESKVERLAQSDKEKSKLDEGAINSVPEKGSNGKDSNADFGMASLGLEEKQNWKRILSDQHARSLLLLQLPLWILMTFDS